MSDVSCVNCPTLDQTYWFLSVGTWIFWALCFSSRMITFSSSHWYFIIIVLLPPSFQTTTAKCPSKKQLCYGCLSFHPYETVCAQWLLYKPRCYIHTVDGSSTFSLRAVPVCSVTCLSMENSAQTSNCHWMANGCSTEAQRCVCCHRIPLTQNNDDVCPTFLAEAMRSYITVII